MMEAVLILVNSKPPPTSKNPRLLFAKNSPFKLLTLFLPDLYHNVHATIPAKKRKPMIIVGFMGNA
jgi:hypothetical protein